MDKLNIDKVFMFFQSLFCKFRLLLDVLNSFIFSWKRRKRFEEHEVLIADIVRTMGSTLL